MNMKKKRILVLIALMATGAFANTRLGPPAAESESGQSKVGYSYSFSETDLDIEGLTLEDTEITRHYIELGCGVAENFEMNLLLGVASVEDDAGFNGSNDFSFGFNAKHTFIEDDAMDWGAMVQATWFSSEDDIGGLTLVTDAFDIQIAVGPTIDMGGWDLYGGVYYYLLDADITVQGFTGSADLEEQENFGGFIGAEVDITENAYLGIEYAFASDTSVIGAGVGFRF